MQWGNFFGGVSSKFNEELRKCPQIFRGQRYQYIFEAADVNDKVIRAQTYVWLSIMKNYSFITDFNHFCANGELYDSSSNILSLNEAVIDLARINSGKIAPHQYTLSFVNQINSIQFITCGNRGLSVLPFIELVAVYDLFVWISLLVTLTCFVIFLKRVWINITFDVIINITKLLLEQGNPFPPSFFNKSSCRMLFGTLSLAALILSNGYKNENVYRMVASRIPITYDTLSNLLQEGFSLHSRTGVATIFFSSLEIPIKWNFRTHYIFTDDRNGFVCSELAALKSALLSKLDNLVLKNAPWSKNAQSKLTVIVSSIHNLSKEVDFEEMEFYFEKQLQDTLKIKEEELLIEEIRKCDKTAVVLPRDAAMRYALQLSHPNVSSTIPGRVNIGKEIYFEQYYAFWLSGHITPYMIRRVKTLQTSGVMDWWEKVIFEGFERTHFVDSRLLPRRPKMDGNIAVIFAVWLAGLTLAKAVWIFEVNSTIWDKLLHIWRFVGLILSALTLIKNYVLYWVRKMCNKICCAYTDDM